MIFKGIARLDFDFQRDFNIRFWFSKGLQDSILIFRGIATLDFDFQRDCNIRFWFSKGLHHKILIFKGMARFNFDFQRDCNNIFGFSNELQHSLSHSVIARFWKWIATLDCKGAGHVYPNLKINVESTLNVECNPFVPAVHIKFVWMNIVCGNIQKAEILGYWFLGKKLRNRKLSLNHNQLLPK